MTDPGFNTDHIQTVEVPVTPASKSIEVKLSRWVFALGLTTAILQGVQSSLMNFLWASPNLKLTGNIICAILGAGTAALGAANVFLIAQLKEGVVSKNVRVDSLPSASKDS